MGVHGLYGKIWKLRKQYSSLTCGLERQVKVDHPLVVEAMEELSRFYNHSGENRKEELMSRELVDIYLRTLGHNDLKTLGARQKVIKSIITQGQYLTEQSLGRDLRSDIFELV